MKRILAYILVGVGGVAALAGVYHVVMGQSGKHIFYDIKAMYVGLAGLAMLVIGLTQARD